MKRITLFTFIAIALLTGCSNADVDTEMAALKERVAKLESTKTVIGIKFVGAQMVITYSTNETATLSMPSGLNGTNGTNGSNGTNGTNGLNGADGTGIKSISYNETTGILTIILTNNNVSEFKVINNGSTGMTAVLISDVNGKMYVSEVTMGAVPIATFTYDNNFNITSMLSKEVIDGNILNSFRINKAYTNGKLSGIQTIVYATKKEVSYNTEDYSLTKDTIVVSNLGDFYKKNKGDSTYRYYKYSYGSPGSYHYTVYPYTVIHAFSSPPNITYSYYAKYNDNIAYSFDYLADYSKITSGVTSYFVVHFISAKYTKTGVLNIGDIESTTNTKIENNSNGNPANIYYEDDHYVKLTYNSGTLVTRADDYENINGTWVKSDFYFTVEYNPNNLVSSIKKNYSNKSPEEIFKTVYDANGNPIEIYSWNGAIYSDWGYFDPFTNPNDPWTAVIVPEGLQLIAKVEYDYAYKNFFGNSISALFPELQNYKIFNAPIKISHAQSMGYGWIDYEKFNDSGYPESIKASLYDTEFALGLQFNISYIKKE
jgi:hypothetical protein